MIGVLTAEAMKLTRHRAIWGLVWIFPIGLVLLFLLAEAVHAAHPTVRSLHGMPADVWIVGSTLVWKVGQSGPGRYLSAAFTALAFGGEYGWNTWKLVVPHSRRWMLLAAKYAMVFALFMAALVICAVLTPILTLIAGALHGQPAPEGVTLGALLSAHLHAAGAAVVSILLSMGYAALAAVALRSTMGGAIVAIVAVTAEGLATVFAPLIDRSLFLLLPTYHLQNLTHWLTDGAGSAMPHPSGLLQEGWPVSLAWVAAWVLVPVAATFALFERQDLN